jgi:hypothetical protein
MIKMRQKFISLFAILLPSLRRGFTTPAMKSILVYPLILGAAIAFATKLVAQPALTPYPVAARLYLSSPVVARGLVKSQTKLSKKENAGLPALPVGQGRAMLEAELQTVLKAPDALPGQLKFLWQGPLDAKGKVPAFKKQTLLLFLTPVTTNGATGYGLTDVNSVRPWLPAEDAQLRTIATAAQDPAQRGLAIEGVRTTFVTVPEDSNSAPYVHILFATTNNAPLAAILEKQSGKWLLRTTLTDLDQDAVAIQRQSLLWYHMACGLAAEPPSNVTKQPTAAESALAREAWSGMLEQLGPCR